MPRNPHDPTKGTVPVTRDGFDIAPDDPKHDFDSTAIQIDAGDMNGFVYDAIKNGHNESNPVAAFDSNSARIINTLAREFASHEVVLEFLRNVLANRLATDGASWARVFSRSASGCVCEEARAGGARSQPSSPMSHRPTHTPALPPAAPTPTRG